ncbi:hypothetical protein ACR6AW_004724 [Escherichia coli]|nr:hypothetical protein [Escherichia coli]MCN5236172.1 hypothetical protein [Escherichia coli]HBA4459816.1 hypothetical protein [Escherichia coli]HEC3216201.1 hypothetical protein [Escherichia coli]HEC3239356.1 hypothetical protein [Escherichia coli]
MLYRDLLPIFSERPIFKAPEAERILREQYSIAAPTPVIQEIYYGLAGYDRFQELYGDLNIDQIEWKLIELPTKNFLTIGDNATCPDFLHEVVEDFTTRKGDVFMDDEIKAHWCNFGTWCEPPFFIDRALLKSNTTGLHLMEGHTRVGTLLGAVKYNFVKLANTHKIYYAQAKECIK